MMIVFSLILYLSRIESSLRSGFLDDRRQPDNVLITELPARLLQMRRHGSSQRAVEKRLQHLAKRLQPGLLASRLRQINKLAPLLLPLQMPLLKQNGKHPPHSHRRRWIGQLLTDLPHRRSLLGEDDVHNLPFAARKIRHEQTRWSPTTKELHFQRTEEVTSIRTLIF